MEAIYKLQTGQHVDLDKIVSISPIVNNPLFVLVKYFEIYFQLCEKPIRITVNVMNETRTDQVMTWDDSYNLIQLTHIDLIQTWTKYKSK